MWHWEQVFVLVVLFVFYSAFGTGIRSCCMFYLSFVVVFVIVIVFLLLLYRFSLWIRVTGSLGATLRVNEILGTAIRSCCVFYLSFIVNLLVFLLLLSYLCSCNVSCIFVIFVIVIVSVIVVFVIIIVFVLVLLIFCSYDQCSLLYVKQIDGKRIRKNGK